MVLVNAIQLSNGNKRHFLFSHTFTIQKNQSEKTDQFVLLLLMETSQMCLFTGWPKLGTLLIWQLKLFCMIRHILWKNIFDKTLRWKPCVLSCLQKDIHQNDFLWNIFCLFVTLKLSFFRLCLSLSLSLSISQYI